MVEPSDQAGVVEAVRTSYEANRAVYPLGGGTAIDGKATTSDGIQLDLRGLNRVVDYTPRDMTILVEAGVRMAALDATLAAEGQCLPIDVPRAVEATLGGVVATNWNGPRRYGHGTIRDYVIGIHAVDGRGVSFKGGGRVVKNVAGYDFCKLLTGSLGTLGVITQLALKVKPVPEQTAAILGTCNDLATADAILSRLVNLPAPPVAIDLLVGPSWESSFSSRHPTADTRHLLLCVRVEGTPQETASLAERVQYELWSGGGGNVRLLEPADAASLWSRQVEFSDRGAGESADNTPLVLKIAVPPSATTNIIRSILEFDPDCTIQAHTGNGIVFARFSRFTHTDLTSTLVAKLRPAATKLGGSAIVVSATLDGLTPHVIWGGRTDATRLMEQIKRQFDPRNILNSGRFIY